MVWSALSGGVLEACADIVRSQVGVVREDLGFGCLGREKTQYVGDPHSGAPDERAPVHDRRIDGDAVEEGHDPTIPASRSRDRPQLLRRFSTPAEAGGWLLSSPPLSIRVDRCLPTLLR